MKRSKSAVELDKILKYWHCYQLSLEIIANERKCLGQILLEKTPFLPSSFHSHTLTLKYSVS